MGLLGILLLGLLIIPKEAKKEMTLRRKPKISTGITQYEIHSPLSLSLFVQIFFDHIHQRRDPPLVDLLFFPQLPSVYK